MWQGLLAWQREDRELNHTAAFNGSAPKGTRLPPTQSLAKTSPRGQRAAQDGAGSPISQVQPLGWG